MQYKEALESDIGVFQKDIAAMTGKTPTTFVYPFGSTSEHTDEIIAELGFKATFLCRGAVNIITKDPADLFGLCRIRRAHGKGIQTLI